LKMKVLLCALLVCLLGITGCSFSCDFGGDEEVETETQEVVSEEPVEIGEGMQRYENPAFAVSYPEDWIYEKPEEHILIFSGREGTEAYDATVNVQTIELGIAYQNLEDIYTDYRDQIASVGGRISDMGQEDFIQDGETYDSIGFFAEYEDGVVFNQFIVAVDRKDGYLQQISYTAPEHIYEQYEDTAINIMDSLELIKGE